MLSVGQKRPRGLQRGDRLRVWAFGLSQQLFSFLGPRLTFWLVRRALLPVIRRSSAPAKIRRNINRAYPQASKAQRQAIEDKVIGSAPDTVAEFLLQPYWRRNAGRILDHNFDEAWLQPYVKNDKPALFLLGHFTGWQASLMAMSGILQQVWMVYAPPKNRLMDPYFCEKRIVPQGVKQGAWRLLPRDLPGLHKQLSKHVRTGGSLLYLLDAPLPGPMLPFLGLTSPTTLAPYQMAVRQQLPLIPLNCHFDQRSLRFRIAAEPPLEAKGSRAEDAVELATRMNAVYSRWIREQPTQWYWVGKFFEPNSDWEARQKRKAQASSSTSQ